MGIRNVLQCGTVKFEIPVKGGKPVKQFEMNRIKEVGKKAIFDFVRSENGSVGIKNAAIIGAFIGMLALSQSDGEAININRDDGIIEVVTIVAI